MQLKDLILPGILISTAFYLWGAWRNWHSAGWGHGLKLWQAACFITAAFVCFIALVSSFDELVDSFFFAHMIQHMLLILIAAPLFSLSAAPQAFLWGLPRRWAHRLAHGWETSRAWKTAWGWISGLWSALILFTVLLWLWHLPALFQAAAENETIHAVEHLCFLFSAMLFWWALLREQRRHARGVVLASLVVSMLQTGLLGALITFDSQLLYPFYQGGQIGTWRLTPMSDQQLAGLIMWLPGGLPFLILIFYNLAQWLEELEKKSEGDENLTQEVKDQPAAR